MANPASTGPAYWTELRNDLSEGLSTTVKDGLQPIHLAQKGMRLSEVAHAKLKESLQHYSFSDLHEQITFYKEVQPFFVSRMIFFNRVFRLETGRPPGDPASVQSYLQKEWQHIRDVHAEHYFLCRYIRAGETWLDEKLFVMNSDHLVVPLNWDLHDSLLHDASWTVARLLSLDLMQDYLLRAEEELNNPRDPKQRNIAKLTWTDSKSALIELAYAIQSAGSLNDRKASLREIIEGLEAAFHIDLGHYPRVFQEILSRKTGYTNYIDRLREKLLLRIKLIEEKYDPK
ncbi:MAG TPA: RteC domain-containing protein [Puia sp.]|uniref:RteC domain-containing protein n=1 Tax=Puia sp. TaxID=2045100 RepID=UPI002D0A5BF0|nr:RteC domain-containing protein [Puia sp.]HVU96809.1 RteC domain-containing protein [Puia sp.]